MVYVKARAKMPGISIPLLSRHKLSGVSRPRIQRGHHPGRRTCQGKDEGSRLCVPCRLLFHELMPATFRALA